MNVQMNHRIFADFSLKLTSSASQQTALYVALDSPRGGYTVLAAYRKCITDLLVMTASG